MKAKSRARLEPALLALLIVAGSGAASAESIAGGEGVWDNVQKADCRIWSKRFDPFELEWRVEGSRSSIRCVTTVLDGERPKKGTKVTLSAEVTGADGNVVSLGSQTTRTDQNGSAVFEFPVSGVSGDVFTARIDGLYRSWRKATSMTTDCRGPGS